MPGIFLSYRREDAGGHVGRLYDRLKRHFGKQGVFRDKELIQPGGDFRRILHHQLSGADLVLAIIGRRWLDTLQQRGTDATGNPDWVVTELTMALDWKIPIIPVLVDGADMPRPEHLPHELKPLANLQARSLEDSDRAITAFVRELPNIVPTLPQKRSWTVRLVATLGKFRVSIGASIIVGSIALFLWGRPDSGHPDSDNEDGPRTGAAASPPNGIEILDVAYGNAPRHFCFFVDSECGGADSCEFTVAPNQCPEDNPAPTRVKRRMTVFFACRSAEGLGPARTVTALDGETIRLSCAPAVQTPSDVPPTIHAVPPPRTRPRGR
jgi:TIR domain